MNSSINLDSELRDLVCDPEMPMSIDEIEAQAMQWEKWIKQLRALVKFKRQPGKKFSPEQRN